MFKILKDKKNIQFVLFYAFAFAFAFIVVVWGGSFLLDDSEQLELLEQLDEESTSLREEIISLGQEIDAYIEDRSKLVDTLREYNELLETGLERYEELFIQLEQRITLLQDVLNDADPDSVDLMTVQAEIADILQSLKDINETEADVLTE